MNVWEKPFFNPKVSVFHTMNDPLELSFESMNSAKSKPIHWYRQNELISPHRPNAERVEYIKLVSYVRPYLRKN